MPQEIKTSKRYSKNFFEEALEKAIAQVKVNETSADMLYHYPVCYNGKRNRWYNRSK